MSLEVRLHRFFLGGREIGSPLEKIRRAADKRCDLERLRAWKRIVEATHLASVRAEDREQPRGLPKRRKQQQPAPKGEAANMGCGEDGGVLVLRAPSEIGARKDLTVQSSAV